MLKSRPEDALGSLVKTIETVTTANCKQCSVCGDCRSENVNYLLTYNLKARDASTSTNQTSYLSFFLHTDFLHTDFSPHKFRTKTA